jgi:hypothetical protein
MIQEKKLYPITLLKGLNAETRNKLATNGIILLKQLTEKTPKELRRQTGVSKEKFGSIVDKARTILSGN